MPEGQQQTTDFMIRAFSKVELVAFTNRYYPDIGPHLEDATLAACVASLLRALLRRGLLNASFYAHLRVERPHRTDEIDQLCLPDTTLPSLGAASVSRSPGTVAVAVSAAIVTSALVALAVRRHYRSVQEENERLREQLAQANAELKLYRLFLNEHVSASALRAVLNAQQTPLRELLRNIDIEGTDDDQQAVPEAELAEHVRRLVVFLELLHAVRSGHAPAEHHEQARQIGTWLEGDTPQLSVDLPPGRFAADLRRDPSGIIEVRLSPIP